MVDGLKSALQEAVLFRAIVFEATGLHRLNPCNPCPELAEGFCTTNIDLMIMDDLLGGSFKSL